MEGWLTKKGGRFATWRRRWFSLDDSKLEYFTDQDKKVSKGLIDIKEVTEVGQILHETRNYCIGIRTDKRLYVVSCDDSASFDSWLESLSSIQPKYLDSEFTNVPHSSLGNLEKQWLSLVGKKKKKTGGTDSREESIQPSSPPSTSTGGGTAESPPSSGSGSGKISLGNNNSRPNSSTSPNPSRDSANLNSTTTTGSSTPSSTPASSVGSLTLNGTSNKSINSQESSYHLMPFSAKSFDHGFAETGLTYAPPTDMAPMPPVMSSETISNNNNTSSIQENNLQANSTGGGNGSSNNQSSINNSSSNNNNNNTSSTNSPYTSSFASIHSAMIGETDFSSSTYGPGLSASPMAHEDSPFSHGSSGTSSFSITSALAPPRSTVVIENPTPILPSLPSNPEDSPFD